MPPDWRSHIHKLSIMMNDDAEFHFALQQFVKESGDAPVDYCLIEGITCNANGQMTAIQIVNVEAKVELAAVPKTVTELSFVGGVMKQPLSLAALPAWVMKVSFDGVKFVQGNAPVNFQIPKGNLRDLTCTRCGLVDVEWDKIPSLMHLDLSHNQLVAVPFDRLPRTLRSLNVSSCGLVVDVSKSVDLPPSLVALDISRNSFSGVFNWNFPNYLETLIASGNQLSGSGIIEKLPVSVVTVDLSNNALSGAFGDTSSFMSLQYVDLSHNKLSTIMWASLPPQLKTLVASHNELTGKLPVEALPTALLHLDVSWNKMSGPIKIDALPKQLEHLDVQHNEFSGPLDFSAFAPAIRFAYFQSNKFSGRPDVTRVPVDMRRLLFGDNDFESLMPPEHDPLDDL